MTNKYKLKLLFDEILKDDVANKVNIADEIMELASITETIEHTSANNINLSQLRDTLDDFLQTPTEKEDFIGIFQLHLKLYK